jgi:hypothetical protein
LEYPTADQSDKWDSMTVERMEIPLAGWSASCSADQLGS